MKSYVGALEYDLHSIGGKVSLRSFAGDLWACFEMNAEGSLPPLALPQRVEIRSVGKWVSQEFVPRFFFSKGIPLASVSFNFADVEGRMRNHSSVLMCCREEYCIL